MKCPGCGEEQRAKNCVVVLGDSPIFECNWCGVFFNADGVEPKIQTHQEVESEVKIREV